MGQKIVNMLGKQRPDEQNHIGPTLSANVGTTKLPTLAQHWDAIWETTDVFPRSRKGGYQALTHNMTISIGQTVRFGAINKC